MYYISMRGLILLSYEIGTSLCEVKYQSLIRLRDMCYLILNCDTISVTLL